MPSDDRREIVARPAVLSASRQASDNRMTGSRFKASPAEGQQEHARLQSNRLKNGTPREGDSAPPLPSRLTSRFFGSDLKPIATTGEAAVRAGLGRGRTPTQTRVQTPRSDTSSETASRSYRTAGRGNDD